MTVVVLDASAAVALLVDAANVGAWVAAHAAGRTLAAPELVMYETANVLRRQVLSQLVSPVEAALAHQDLIALPVELWPYGACATRAWQLRDTLTSYDAAYVAVAELLDADLLTLDLRLARASGPTCPILTPP